LTSKAYKFAHLTSRLSHFTMEDLKKVIFNVCSSDRLPYLRTKLTIASIVFLYFAK